MPMTEVERIERAERRLRDIMPQGTRLFFARIDYGRKNAQKRYYAVLVIENGEIKNVSGTVARFTGLKWSNEIKNNHWANSSGVLASNSAEIREALAQKLYNIWDAKGTDNCFPFTEL